MYSKLCNTYLSIFLFFSLCVQGFTPPLLVFVQSKKRAKELFHELISGSEGHPLTHCSVCSVMYMCRLVHKKLSQTIASLHIHLLIHYNHIFTWLCE